MAYITTAQLKSYLNITVSTDDTELGYACDRATVMIETFTHRTFIASEQTRYYTPLNVSIFGDLIDDYTLDLADDFISISNITNGDGTNIPVNQVQLLNANLLPYWAIRIKQSSNYFWSYTNSPEGSVAITGMFGYSASVPADIEAACLRLATYLYRQREGTPDTDRAILSVDGVILAAARIPDDVRAMLASYVRKF